MSEVPPPPPMAMPPVPQNPGASKNNLGTWALVLGIVSILCCGWLAGIPAIILGNMGKSAAAQGLATNGSQANVGFILGIIGTVLGVILMIVNFTTGFGNYDFSSSF